MRKRSLNRFLTLGIGLFVAVVLSGGASAQFAPSNLPTHGAPTHWHPDSNRQKPSDIGLRVHTNVVGVLLPVPNARPPEPRARGLAPQTVPLSGYYFETPSSLACIYGFVTQTTGCNPSNTTAVVSGGTPLAIAIVDAFHNPNILSDLKTFAKQFGLPAPGSNFQVVSATGKTIPADMTGWSLESSLDVEWAYAMSPNAKIYLIEAASDYVNDLLAAVDKASSLVAAAGGGVVSMSWGGSEFSGETSYDSHFKAANVMYIASSGDAPGVSWPSSSAFVISAGGTSISRNPATGDFVGEMTWQQAGSGISQYVTRPSYQNGQSSLVGSYRGVPDIAAVADPDTGVWVYAQYACTYIYVCDGTNWLPVGGTSAAAPIEAAVISHKGVKYTTSQAALSAIYTGSMGTFRDIAMGNCGPYAGYVAATGWDLCTGRGSVLGTLRMTTASTPQG